MIQLYMILLKSLQVQIFQETVKGTMIGTNVTILPKVKIGSNVIVAAGSVVTKDIPDNCMVAGVPAVVKKELLKPSI